MLLFTAGTTKPKDRKPDARSTGRIQSEEKEPFLFLGLLFSHMGMFILLSFGSYSGSNLDNSMQAFQNLASILNQEDKSQNILPIRR